MQIIIVTGMSGAGKSTVLKIFEDYDYFCIDNLPPSLISKFLEICTTSGSEIKKIAIGVDIRGGILFNDLIPALEYVNESFDCNVLYLDASDETLVNRYKETRRSHPLAKSDRIMTGIIKEREILSEIKKKSTYIVDTSHILTRQLREKISAIFIQNEKFNSLMITILSFGFKYGIPTDSDLVFDVRFLPNPFYIEEMRELTGNDKSVSDYVMSFEISQEFMDKLTDMIEFLLPNYIEEGKNQLVISIGCTGGKHRSVTLANGLHDILKEKGQSVIIRHRDANKTK